MRIVENRMIAIDKLVLPEDFETRLESEDVQELTESIEQIGLLNVPLVRLKDLKVICGSDRVASRRRAGRKLIEVRIIDCTDLEAEMIEVDENLKRRGYSQEKIDAMRAKRLEIEERILAEENDKAESADGQPSEDAEGAPEKKPQPEKKKRDRGRPRNEALARAAENAKVSPRTIQRAKKKQKDKASPNKPPKKDPPPIPTHGFAVNAEKLENVRELVKLFAEADRHMRNAKSALTRAETSNLLIVDPGMLARAKEEIATAGHTFRRMIPIDTCLWCKGHPLLFEACGSCGGLCYAREDQIENAPKELREWSPDKAMVFCDGRLVRYADVTEDDVLV